jgi:hypothetical protein
VKKSLSLDCIEDAFMLQHGVLKNMGFMQAVLRNKRQCCLELLLTDVGLRQRIHNRIRIDEITFHK